MASKTPENGNDQGSASVQINKKILELKKKLLLAGIESYSCFSVRMLNKMKIYRGAKESLYWRMDTTRKTKFRFGDRIEKGYQRIDWKTHIFK